MTLWHKYDQKLATSSYMTWCSVHDIWYYIMHQHRGIKMTCRDVTIHNHWHTGWSTILLFPRLNQAPWWGGGGGSIGRRASAALCWIQALSSFPQSPKRPQTLPQNSKIPRKIGVLSKNSNFLGQSNWDFWGVPEKVGGIENNPQKTIGSIGVAPKILKCYFEGPCHF